LYFATTDTHIGFESWLERDYLMLTDFDPAVRAIAAQPFWLCWRDEDDRARRQATFALADNVLGQVRLGQGDNDAAAQRFTDGLAVARRAQDWLPLLTLLYDLALARQAQGDLAGAAGHLQEGLALAAEAGDETSAAYYLEVLAARCRTVGQPAACRTPVRCRPLHPGRQGQRLAARLRAPRPARRCGPAGLRSRIGYAAFQEAQAWGRSAGSQRAVEFALE
jgi:hypothetical protein